ncbi:28S Ribosomal Protein S33 [Manis pentadactyla]|nr:28S Ribosomal Protein S33 [Manis pentadactyla]
MVKRVVSISSHKPVMTEGDSIDGEKNHHMTAEIKNGQNLSLLVDGFCPDAQHFICAGRACGGESLGPPVVSSLQELSLECLLTGPQKKCGTAGNICQKREFL